MDKVQKNNFKLYDQLPTIPTIRSIMVFLSLLKRVGAGEAQSG
jgi:hypothetical protein